MISKETEYYYSRPALMYIYMGHMKREHTQPYENWYWKKRGITLVLDEVTQLQPDNKTLILKQGTPIHYDSLVIATGSASNKFGWLGQDLPGVQGLYSMQDLELMDANTRRVRRSVIVGGGLIGIEMAEMLLSRNIPVTMLVREKEFWDIVIPEAEAKMIGRHAREHHVDLRLETELKEILPDSNGRVRAVVTNKEEKIPCEFVGLTVGVHPNIDFLRNDQLEVDRGVLIDDQFNTNLPDVYAAGDCAQFREPLPGRRAIEQVWYTGKMHAETLALTLTGKACRYRPGVWWNSAKFFDIEYQTYGIVPPKLPDNQASLYWEDPKGNRCVRINYRTDNRSVQGFNFFGIRARHQICEKWILEKRTVDYVLTHLGALNFDPEFFKGFEDEVNREYNRQNPKNPIRLKTKKGLCSNYFQKFFRLKEGAIT